MLAQQGQLFGHGSVPVLVAADRVPKIGKGRHSSTTVHSPAWSNWTPCGVSARGRPVVMTSGFESMCPLAHRCDASHAIHILRARSLPAASFGLSFAEDALAFRLNALGVATIISRRWQF